VPAGKLCDFPYHDAFTATDNAVIFPNGRMIEHAVIHASHTNLATGYTLTETDHFNFFTAANGQTKIVGVQWHLRNAQGKIVLVMAGLMVISPTGKVLKFTPNTNPDFAAVICPALGGQSASAPSASG
jgi:hypothetical protein